jgi:hypothetical protein
MITQRSKTWFYGYLLTDTLWFNALELIAKLKKIKYEITSNLVEAMNSNTY